MKREEMLNRVRERQTPWDVIVIGGGASGAGCALDAASRGFDVLLLEQFDFGKGTSSRSTKLVHGGVRYLEKGDISLVREALKERGILKRNAPHLVETQPFVVPCYSLWQKLYYGTGLKVYNLLSGNLSFGKSKILSRAQILEKLPNIKRENLKGGVTYFDGQFDDTRLLLEIIQTAAGKGATLLNYTRVFSLTKDLSGKIEKVNFECTESGELFSLRAKAVINATGVFTDQVRRLSDKNTSEIISPSQGIHLVFDQKFLKSPDALMIPKTSDGRVLFAIPWHGKTLVGTTDTPLERVEFEPKPLRKEIEFILQTCRDYLAEPPDQNDVLSIFAGIRPLVKAEGTKNTAALSRDHTIEIDNSNLITLTGGKWTTYRHMAEDAVNQAIKVAGLPGKKCVTSGLTLENKKPERLSRIIAEDKNLSEKIHPDFPYQKAEIVHAVRYEMARTPEDVLARRMRFLFLDARAAIDVSYETAEIMARETGKDKIWIEEKVSEFKTLAKNYLIEAYEN